MKKIIIFLTMAVLSFGFINAQTAYEKAKVLDNTYVGVYGGITSPMAKHLTPFNTLAGVKLGKNFSPIYGANVEGTFWFGDHAYMDGKTTLKTSYVGLNNTLNITNLFYDYRADRVFEASLEAGIGWAHYYNALVGDEYKDLNDLGVKTAAVFAWNLGKKKAWQIYAEPAVYWNLTRSGSPQFNRHNAQMGIQCGVVYKFKTSNKTHNFKAYDITALYDDIASLEVANKALAEENEMLKNRPVVIQEVIKEITETVFTDNTVSVSFVQNSAELTEDAKTILARVPKNLKVKVMGATSPEGTEARNTDLALERANAVADYLKSLGVDVVSARGAEAGRIAVVTVVK